MSTSTISSLLQVKSWRQDFYISLFPWKSFAIVGIANTCLANSQQDRRNENGVLGYFSSVGSSEADCAVAYCTGDRCTAVLGGLSANLSDVRDAKKSGLKFFNF